MVVDKSYPHLKRLLDDAEFQLVGTATSVDDEVVREALLSSQKLLRLVQAKSRSTEAISYITDIMYSEANKEYYSRSLDSISIISDILARDYSTYSKVLKILYPKESSEVSKRL